MKMIKPTQMYMIEKFDHPFTNELLKYYEGDHYNFNDLTSQWKPLYQEYLDIIKQGVTTSEQSLKLTNLDSRVLKLKRHAAWYAARIHAVNIIINTACEYIYNGWEFDQIFIDHVFQNMQERMDKVNDQMKEGRAEWWRVKQIPREDRTKQEQGHFKNWKKAEMICISNVQSLAKMRGFIGHCWYTSQEVINNAKKVAK